MIVCSDANAAAEAIPMHITSAAKNIISLLEFFIYFAPNLIKQILNNSTKTKQNYSNQ